MATDPTIPFQYLPVGPADSSKTGANFEGLLKYIRDRNDGTAKWDTLNVSGNADIDGTLNVDGASTFVSAVKISDGTVGAPGLSFSASGQQDNGIYRIGSDNWGMSAGGTKALDLSSTLVSTPLSLSVTGDIYTTAFTDYSNGSTVSGWSSFATKTIFYKKVGKTVFFWFFIQGTSNATTITFTLPVATTGLLIDVPCRAIDNGASQVDPGLVEISSGSTTVNVYKTMAGGAWTNSGSKAIGGQFIYETA